MTRVKWYIFWQMDYATIYCIIHKYWNRKYRYKTGAGHLGKLMKNPDKVWTSSVVFLFFNINKWFKPRLLSPLLCYLDLLIGSHVCALDVIELKKKNENLYRKSATEPRPIQESFATDRQSKPLDIKDSWYTRIDQ